MADDRLTFRVVHTTKDHKTSVPVTQISHATSGFKAFAYQCSLEEDLDGAPEGAYTVVPGARHSGSHGRFEGPGGRGAALVATGCGPRLWPPPGAAVRPRRRKLHEGATWDNAISPLAIATGNPAIPVLQFALLLSFSHGLMGDGGVDALRYNFRSGLFGQRLHHHS
jgi:hypothetical protein